MAQPEQNLRLRQTQKLLRVEAITGWLEQGKSFPPQEIAKRPSLLVSAIFKETSTWQ